MMITMIMMLIKSIVTFICVALGVGFFTLMERKVLSYIQSRKGPNKVGIAGLPQPLADAAKLFTKENPPVTKSNKLVFMLSPALATLIMFCLWNLYMSPHFMTPFKLGVLFFFAVSSLNVYCILLSGWASNSKYALLGAIRAVAQTVSYEVSMALCLMMVLMLSWTFDFKSMGSNQEYSWYSIMLMPALGLWLITSLAETNRAPFDLAEGESELVSGFNIEYGSGEFALLFIAEYGSILLLSMITTSLFLKGQMDEMGLESLCKTLAIAYFFLWVRGSYPRMRYDSLMSLTWKTFLMVTLTTGVMLLGADSWQ